MQVSRKEKGFVLLQFIVFVAYLFEISRLQIFIPENLRWIALFGAVLGLALIVVAVLQLNTNLSPFPSPRPGAKLITSGVFAFARHPIFSGLLFLLFGVGFWLESGYKLIIAVLLWLVFFAKSQYEEKKLEETFPEYPFYKRQTGRFFPKFIKGKS